VQITAGTTYVASYHTTAPFLAYTPNTFASAGVDNAPLHALANGVSGGDGVYAYGPSAFPALSNGQAPNYWVDVAFSPATTSPPPTSPPPTSPPPVSPPTVDTIFGNGAPSASQQNVNDSHIPAARGVEVGVKFTSDVAGYVTGVRFYKGSLDTGVHTGELWSSSGQLLATVTFTNETASGWQQALFSTPVAITANTVYVVSYHTTAGYLAYTPNTLATSGVDNSPLHALENSTNSPDGVYVYGASAFPSLYNGQAPNYWVDVDFQTSVGS
jgi:hypothetical protein